jgi:hypothetical protein
MPLCGNSAHVPSFRRGEASFAGFFSPTGENPSKWNAYKPTAISSHLSSAEARKLRYVTTSEAAARSLAENYVGFDVV